MSGKGKSSGGKKKEDDGVKIVCHNPKARHNYAIGDDFEAGMVLSGSEVKSLRAQRADLRESFAQVKSGEVWLLNAHISPYDPASRDNREPARKRKLLLHRAEIRKLIGKTKEKGTTLVPLDIHFRDGRAKVRIALARGKKIYDKREDVKRREADMELRKALKRRGRMR